MAYEESTDPVVRLAQLVARLRPDCKTPSHVEANLRAEVKRLAEHAAEAEQLGAILRHLLALPNQSGFYAESGVRSALGSWPEFFDRVGLKVLPPRRDDGRLRDVMRSVFRPADAVWVAAIDDGAWAALAHGLGMDDQARWGGAADVARSNLFGAVRLLSYRLAGASLDRELLLSNASLERDDSPFLAQNVALERLLGRWRAAHVPPGVEGVVQVQGHLDVCDAALQRVRGNACEQGISVRLTYHVARQEQLIERLRQLLVFIVADDALLAGARLMKIVLVTEQARDQLTDFVGENLILVARNITDHAGRRGEHYIAEDRVAWWAIGKGAAGAGLVIAVMAVVKVKVALLHLPPLTEGAMFGVSYALGFVVIHLLGLTVATKQPAMTAASIAATVEESDQQDLERLADLTQNVLRTQNIAVAGNVLLALPVAAILGTGQTERTVSG